MSFFEIAKIIINTNQRVTN
uniref:Uncharacterized protein n=1 Tax=Anguilla anguilla TaxID=7936 RepID=A0A0E9WDI6_ANGAN